MIIHSYIFRHYSATSFSKNGQPTIEAKSTTKDQMGQREGFSKKDIEKVNKMYKCTTVSSSSDATTIKPQGGFAGLIEALFPSSSMDEEEMIEN
jgi:hypothetical protein